MKYFLIFIIAVFYFPSAFALVCKESFSVSLMNIVNKKMSRVQRIAGIQLRQVLKEIRETPQEPALKAQGFTPAYYRGVDQTREFNEVAKYLREIKADPKKTHIPYFADQIEKTINDFENSFRNHNQDKPEFLEERLSVLEVLKLEAQRRVEDQNITYDWWADFNLHLTLIIGRPDVIKMLLMMRNRGIVVRENPAERVKLGIEIAYNKELVQEIEKRIYFYSEVKKESSERFQNLQKAFEQLNPEEIFVEESYKSYVKKIDERMSEKTYTSEYLERILGTLLINSGLRRVGRYYLSVEDEIWGVLKKVQEEQGWYSIDTLKTYEEMQELLSDIESQRKHEREYARNDIVDDIYYLIRIKERFPEEIMFFTTDEPGVMAFNRLEDNSYFIGVSGSPVKADGRTLDSFQYFSHDISHIHEQKRSKIKDHQNILKRIENISSRLDREKAEIDLFIRRHENVDSNDKMIDSYIESLSKKS